MSFVMHALLTVDAPAVSNETIRTMFDARFGRTKNFTTTVQQIPFGNERRIRADWGGWSIILSYDEGQPVKDDCAEIKRRLGAAAPPGLESIERRVHAFFADDPSQSHITEAVDAMGVLEEIPGAIVYDPQRNRFLNRS